jgi:hypothetical protein
MNSQTPIASDLSYESFKRVTPTSIARSALRRRRLHLSSRSSGYAFIVNRRRFIADVEEFAGDSASPVPLARAVGEREE